MEGSSTSSPSSTAAVVTVTSTTYTIFILSILWFKSKQRQYDQIRPADCDRKHSNRRRDHCENCNNSSVDRDKNYYDNVATCDFKEEDEISPRGTSCLKKSTSYWKSFLTCLQNPCDKNTNPEGHIALCLAENKLVQEALAIRLMQQGTGVNAFSDSAVYCYNGFLGLPAAREAIAHFLTKRFWKQQQKKKVGLQHHVSNPIDNSFEGSREEENAYGGMVDKGVEKNPSTMDMDMNMEQRQQLQTLSSTQVLNSDSMPPTTITMQGTNNTAASSRNNGNGMINPEHVAFGSGVGSLLSHLFYILAERGDVILIPAPYYASFEYDAKAIAGCKPRPLYMDNPICGPSLKDLENATNILEKEGLQVKILLLTNPNDPLGVVYKRDVMCNAVTWARTRNIHTIVDEVYALSTHKPESNPDHFESIIQILDNKLDNDVHFLWGFSKDFGASGFRIGILYTQNERLLQALANLNMFSGVSHPMQMIVAEIVSDDDFVDAFLDDARSHLTWSYNICIQKLEEMVIPFVPADAGLFVYVDFSSLLPEPTFEGERRFAAFVQEVARVVMTPGESQRDCKPGMFRLCYAWVSSDVLEIAMERLSYLVLQIRRHRWDEDMMKGNWRNEVIKCGTHLSMRRSFSINVSDLSHYKSK